MGYSPIHSRYIESKGGKMPKRKYTRQEGKKYGRPKKSGQKKKDKKIEKTEEKPEFKEAEIMTEQEALIQNHLNRIE